MIQKIIAIYPGRFQPFGMQHKVVYDWAAKKFGVNNTFIATSNKTDNVKSPFNFAEKKSILRLFNLENKVQEVKNTYNAVEITSKFNENTTAVVYVIGEKDQDRLSKGKYFLPYPGDNQPLKPYTENGYYIVGPKNKEVIPSYGEMNGTNVRKVLSNKNISLPEKHKLFKYIFGTYSKPMADFIIGKLMSLQETKLFSKNWWTESLSLNEDLCWSGYKQIGMKKKGSRQVPNCVPVTENESFVSEAYADEFPKNRFIQLSSEKLRRYADNIIQLIAQAYAEKGGNYELQKPSDLRSTDLNYWISNDIDDDPDADVVLGGKKTANGIKITVAGNDGSKESRKSILTKMTELMKKKGFYAEMDLDLAKKMNLPIIIDESLVKNILRGKTINWKSDGTYARDIAGHKKTKVMVGIPKMTKVNEGYMSAKVLAKHNKKISSLRDFLNQNTGKEFIYDFNSFPKTVFGVPMADLQESLILEGGAGGHVLHPFNLPQVKTGKDLIKVFEDVATSLKTVPARIKIDGVNTTLKLVTRNGKLQFAMDRGSKKEEDLQGVTVSELGKRFPEGHGMLKIGKLVLNAFNDALPKIASDLKAIGMSDPNILLNLETVLLDQGKANVIGYERNFFAIHGLMKSEMINGRRVIKEIPVNAQAIEKIVEKAKPVMDKIGFDLYGFKKLQPRIKQAINYSGALNTKFTVKYDGNTEVTKTLKDWLVKASNPVDATVKLNTGKSEPVMTKRYYLDVLNQEVNLNDLTTDPKEQKKIIDAAVFYHATVLLGDVILKSLTSDVGEVENHEGIMIRDNKISKEPFKITGHFIVQGMASGFRKK